MGVSRVLAAVSRWGTGLIFLGLWAGVVLANGLYWCSGSEHILAFCLLAAGFGLFAAFRVLRPRAEALTASARAYRTWAAGILALCLGLRLFWVLTYSVTPEGDYGTFHNLAAALAESWRIAPGTYLDQYIPTFPHIFGYASFLSVFYRLFGPSPLAAAVVNAALSCVSCLCLMELGRRLQSPLCGLLAGLAWAVLPSQIIYNMFVLSEPLYTCLILLAALCAHAMAHAPSRAKRLGLGALLGLLLALIQASRPIAAIGLIMLALWLFLFRPPENGGAALRRAGLLGLVCAVYLLACAGNDALLESRLGTAPAKSAGYSLAVGFNAAGGGLWNEEDSAYLTERMYAGGDYDPEALQQEMAGIARQRLGELLRSPGTLLRLMAGKFRSLLVDDRSCVFYAGDSVPHPAALSGLCDGAWLFLWLLSLPAGVYALRRREGAPLMLVLLFVLGLVSAQMLVEVAGRYHYALMAPLCLLAACSAVLPGPGCAARHGKRAENPGPSAEQA